MDVKKLILAIVCAFSTSVGLSVVLIYSIPSKTSFAGYGFLFGLILFSYWMYRMERLKQIMGRTLTVLGLEAFAMPIAMFLFTVWFVKTQTKETAEAIGGAIGGGIAITITAIVGFFLGAIFLIAGHYISKK